MSKNETTVDRTKVYTVTNFMFLGSDDASDVIAAKNYLTDNFKTIRVSGIAICNTIIDNTNGKYAYDENYNRLLRAYTDARKDNPDLSEWPSILCQFESSKELELDDLLAIPMYNSEATITNRWHLKWTQPGCGGITNPQMLCIHKAGYISIVDRKVRKELTHNQPQQMLYFVESNGIDAVETCPKCGELELASKIRKNHCLMCREKKIQKRNFS